MLAYGRWYRRAVRTSQYQRPYGSLFGLCASRIRPSWPGYLRYARPTYIYRFSDITGGFGTINICIDVSWNVSEKTLAVSMKCQKTATRIIYYDAYALGFVVMR